MADSSSGTGSTEAKPGLPVPESGGTVNDQWGRVTSPQLEGAPARHRGEGVQFEYQRQE